MTHRNFMDEVYDYLAEHSAGFLHPHDRDGLMQRQRMFENKYDGFTTAEAREQFVDEAMDRMRSQEKQRAMEHAHRLELHALRKQLKETAGATLDMAKIVQDAHRAGRKTLRVEDLMRPLNEAKERIDNGH